MLSFIQAPALVRRCSRVVVARAMRCTGGTGRVAALLFSLFAIPALANAAELAPGFNECPIGASVNGQFDAGWFHNSPSLTRNQDFRANPPANNDPQNGWIETAGANPLVVASATAELTGSGLVEFNEGPTRSRYLQGNITTGSTLTDAANNNWYLEYKFTTPAVVAAGTFFKKVHVVSYQGSNFQLAVRVFEGASSDFWTIAQDVHVNVNRANGDANTWQRFSANNTRYPMLKPNTQYTVRLYLYNRIGSAVIAANTNPGIPAGMGVISADDFQFGTGVCPPATLKLTKISNGKAGTFSFAGTNGFPTENLTTTAAGSTGQASVTHTLTATNTQTVVTENAAAGFRLGNISCTGLGSGGNATTAIAGNGANGGSVTLDAAATTWGSNIACTFTNESTEAGLWIRKSNNAPSLVSGTQTTYTIELHNDGPGAADQAVVRDTPAAGLGNCAVVANSCSPTAITCPANLSDVLTPSGLTLPLLPAGSGLKFQVQCQVQ